MSDMPRNRRAVPKEQRLDAIIDVARARFTEHRYKETSIADIAADVGVAPGAIHWYFPAKDDLFAAALRRITDDARAQLGKATDGDPEATLVAFLAAAEPHRYLHVDAHDRLAESDAVAGVHDDLHAWLDGLLLAAIRRRLPRHRDVELVADTAHVLFEGLLGSTLRRDRPMEEVMRFVIEALTTAARQQSNEAARARRRKAAS